MSLTSYILEAVENMSIKDMVTVIKNKIDICDDDTKRFIYNKVISNSLRSNIEDFLSTKYSIGGRVNTGIIEDILDHAAKYGDVEKLNNLCTERRLISFDRLLAGNNIRLEISNLGYGFSDKFIEWLTNYTPKNMGKGMGSYEILLQLFVEGGHLSNKGDVGIGNQELELKGKDARLTGQVHWGNGTSVSDVFCSTLERSRNYNVYKPFIDRINSMKGQLYYTKSNPFSELIDSIKKDNDMYSEVLDAYSTGLSKLYKDLKPEEIREMIDEIDMFSRHGKVDTYKVINACAAMDLYYYANIENFSYIGFFGGNTKASIDKYKIVSGDDIRKSISEAFNIVSNYLKCGSPNTKSGATPQDSFSQINIK